jgi:DeoR family fructose operon transcriptional repressor
MSSSVVFAPARRARVAAIVHERRAVRVKELRAELGVSLATLRRDLDELEAAGALHRVHGGAISIDHRPVEARFESKAEVNAHSKARIAARARELIQPGETIYLDAGSTTLALAGLIRDRVDLTVVTNSLPAMVSLVGRGPRILVVGGELRPLSQAIVGPYTRLLLDQLYVDRAFIGTFGLSLDAGLTTTDSSEAYTKELVLSRARQVVLLADASKLGTRSFAHAGRLDQIDVLITDEAPDEPARATFDRAAVRVIVADVPVPSPIPKEAP